MLLHWWEKVLKPVPDVPDECVHGIRRESPWLHQVLKHLEGSVKLLLTRAVGLKEARKRFVIECPLG